MRRLCALLSFMLFAPVPAIALDVSHYYLDLLLHPEAQHIEAMASLDLTVAKEDLVAGKFPLHFVGMTVEMVAVDGLIVDYEHSGGLLTVGLPEGMGPGSHQVEVHYYGTPEPDVTDWGTWGMVFEANRVFTVNVIEGARHWFPCHDVLSDKASFEIRVTVPETWEVAAPGKLLQVDQGNVVRSFHWLSDWPLPTYLMHFAAAPYTVIEEEHDGIPYLYFLHPTEWEVAQATLNHAPTAMAMLQERYGDYPFPKVGFDEINLGGAVEQPSCVSIGTQIFAAPEDFADVVAHEMAHSWFQGLVTIADWKDLWLSEGLATYHEALYYGYLNGPEAEQDYVASLALSYRTNAQAVEGFFPVYDPQQMWGVTVYRKGALVFHMLRYLVGDVSFEALLNDYLAEFGGGNASTADFQQVAAESSGVDLQPFFDEWVYGVGYPQFQVAWRFADGQLDVRVAQAQPDEWATFTSLPLDLLVHGQYGAYQLLSVELTGRVTTTTFELAFEPSELAVDPAGWWLLKSTFVDYPKSPVEFVEVAEGPPLTTDISTVEPVEIVEFVETMGTADAQVESETGRPGGGCNASDRGGWPGMLLAGLLLAFVGLMRQCRHQSRGNQ